MLRLLTLVAAALLLSAGSLSVDPRVAGGTDGAGGLPKPSGPSTPSQPPPSSPPPSFAVVTVGIIAEAQTRQPIPNALVVITDAVGHPVGIDTTDSVGGFSLYLLDKPGLELAVPSEGLAGIEIEAGDTLLILVP